MSRLSWSEIETTVRKSRIDSLQHSTHSPTNTHFCDGYMFFIGPLNDSEFNENTIFYVELPVKGNTTAKVGEFELNTPCHTSWIKLIYDVHDTIDGDCMGYSKEEELLRERKRLSSHGISSFDFNPDSGKLLFSSGRRLFLTNVKPITTGQQVHVDAELLPSLSACNRMDPKICLSNPHLIGFINASDLWVMNVETNEEIQLTFSKSLDNNNIACSVGVPSYVMQEEFDRFTGYWWSPKLNQDTEATGGVSVQRILYEYVDESEVDEAQIVSLGTWPSVNSSVDTYRYPKAGNKNAKSYIRIAEFSWRGNKFDQQSLKSYQLKVPLAKAIPWVEYVVDFGWMPNADGVWILVLDRLQSRQALLRIPMSSFTTKYLPITNSNDILFEIMWEEKSSIWINISRTLYFLPGKNDNGVSFIWSSELSGFRHLYHREIQFGGNDVQYRHVRKCPIIKDVQLTNGDWEVGNEKVWLDENHQIVYFVGTKDTPLEQHLYAVRLDQPLIIHRLTTLGYYYEVAIDPKCNCAVISSSSLTSSLKVSYCELKHPSSSLTGDQLIEDENVIVMLENHWIDTTKCIPAQSNVELFQFQNTSGFILHGLLFKPKQLQADTKYPTLLYVYGGPAVQLVTNSQKSVRRFLFTSLTSLGYAVVVIDTMGSYHRGLKFEGHLKDKMGVVEIYDQVAGLEYIAEKSGIIDMDRIAIHGWSYGGYLSLMGLVLKPEIFKIAIAGAPVTAWELYDTGYTERYIGLPKDNPNAYFAGSVLSYIHQFPNAQNRLLLVHGLTDENVHFTHTATLINALVKEGKPYQLQIYPNERHGLRQPSSAQHHETSIIWFLQQGFENYKHS